MIEYISILNAIVSLLSCGIVIITSIKLHVFMKNSAAEIDMIDKKIENLNNYIVEVENSILAYEKSLKKITFSVNKINSYNPGE